MDYVMGNHPLWQLFRMAYQITRKPWVLAGVALELGYLNAYIHRVERPVSREFVSFHRREEMLRLRRALIRLPWLNKKPHPAPGA
jgi:hypothetical protein